MTNFAQFTETNDSEGETWTFWLQVDGNEDQLAELWDLLLKAEDESDEDWPYDLADFDTEVIPEHDVDVLVKYANNDEGYMAAHTKITGQFTCPTALGEEGRSLYKGGIAHFFEAVSE